MCDIWNQYTYLYKIYYIKVIVYNNERYLLHTQQVGKRGSWWEWEEGKQSGGEINQNVLHTNNVVKEQYALK